MTSPSQARSGKEKLPERLLIHKSEMILVDDCQPRAGEWVATIHDDAICAELVRRYEAHEEMRNLLFAADGYIEPGVLKDNIRTILATHHP